MLTPRRSNILRILDSASDSELREGREWYRNARSIAAGLADKYMLESVEHGAGIIAALSPSTAWHVNIRDAHAVCSARQGDPLPACSTYGPMIYRAIQIRDGAKPLDVLGGPKVIRFYKCIINPESCTDVVIDRHAFMLATGAVRDLKESLNELKRKGRYQTNGYSRCQRAAKERSMLPHQLQATTWLTWRRLKRN